MPFPKDKFPEELVRSFKNNSSIFFIGAGLSMERGLPSWSKLIEDLIDLASEQPWISKERENDYRKLLRAGDSFLLLAEELKSELGETFYTYVRDKYGKPNISPTDTVKQILGFDTKLVITTNYDRIIENSYAEINGYAPPSLTYTQSKEIANNFWKGNFFVLKAHGDAFVDSQQIILSQKDYRKTLFRELGYKSIIQAIFTSKSILFLGTSMTDPEFNLLLDYMHESYSGGGPTHYLLIDEDMASPTQQRRFKEDYKIQVITYKNISGDHKEVKEFLDSLKKEVS